MLAVTPASYIQLRLSIMVFHVPLQNVGLVDPGSGDAMEHVAGPGRRWLQVWTCLLYVSSTGSSRDPLPQCLGSRIAFEGSAPAGRAYRSVMILG